MGRSWKLFRCVCFFWFVFSKIQSVFSLKSHHNVIFIPPTECSHYGFSANERAPKSTTRWNLLGRKRERQKKQLGYAECLLAWIWWYVSIFFTSVTCIPNSVEATQMNDSYNSLLHVFFPVRVVYNEPTNGKMMKFNFFNSSQVVGWETESTAPSTATIQPRSAVAVLEAEHVAPHAKPPWHSVSTPKVIEGVSRHLVSKIHQKQNYIHVSQKFSTHLYLILTLFTSTDRNAEIQKI